MRAHRCGSVSWDKVNSDEFYNSSQIRCRGISVSSRDLLQICTIVAHRGLRVHDQVRTATLDRYATLPWLRRQSWQGGQIGRIQASQTQRQAACARACPHFDCDLTCSHDQSLRFATCPRATDKGVAHQPVRRCGKPSNNDGQRRSRSMRWDIDFGFARGKLPGGWESSFIGQGGAENDYIVKRVNDGRHSGRQRVALKARQKRLL